MNILIVEDEDLYADQLEVMVEKMGYHCTGIADNSVDALALVQKEVPDLLLMDVNIQGDFDGIEVTQRIREKHPFTPVIFVTSMNDDMTFRRATRVGAVQFIVKPFSDLQLQRAIELAILGLNQMQAETKSTDWSEDILMNDHLFLKVGNRLEKVIVRDILFIEASDKYLFLHFPNRRLVLNMPMKKLKDKLDSNVFFQAHRSFLVNIQQVEAVNLNEQVLLFGDKMAPISKRNKEALLKRLKYLS